jgi:hypothetical protein
VISTDPGDHYNDNPSDHPYGFDLPERCVACRELYPCTVTLADLPDNDARIASLRFWQKQCLCDSTTNHPYGGGCPLHEPCDAFCGAARDPGDDVAELKRALRHARAHSVWAGCSHGD